MAAASPWIWNARLDLAAFWLPAAIAIGLSLIAPKLGIRGELPPWAWLAFVVAIDVAHVHTTLFRTYFDKEELAKRKAFYALLPVGVYALGVLLHAESRILFWRVLAYAAVFHFVRQQVGWVAICRARAGERDRAGRLFDELVIYAVTIYPVLYWHANIPRAFHWFVDDDFIPWPELAPAIYWLQFVYGSLLAAYAVRESWLWHRRRFTSWSKHTVVFSTALLWYVGIVGQNNDFTFTLTNVVGHGVPYGVLLWMYTKERARDAESTVITGVVRLGVGAFLATVLVLALAEEALWDRLIWHERPWLFGGQRSETPLHSPWFQTLIVPLLSVPQATHYALDAFLWRRKDTNRAQAAALGF
ncbi:MAG: hypothetical protein IPK82_14380 [Polyangiaceae bacterium]|nr:hypothetical protein [Polyangiaceae bacterium]